MKKMLLLGTMLVLMSCSDNSVRAISQSDPVIVNCKFTYFFDFQGVKRMHVIDYTIVQNQFSKYDYANFENGSETSSGNVQWYFYEPDGRFSHHVIDGEGMAHYYYDEDGKIIGVQDIFEDAGMSSLNSRYFYFTNGVIWCERVSGGL